MLCAIWHHLHNFKKVKNTHEGMLLLVKMQASKRLNDELLDLSYYSNVA